MKKIIFLSLTILLFSIGLKAQQQQKSLDQILEQYYKASRMDKLQKVQTIVMKGMIVQNDIMPLKIVRMRPDKYMMEYDVADLTSYQVYDGNKAWMTTPWTSNPRPRPMPDGQALDIRNRADFDGLLYDWKAKGHTAELAGTDTVDTSLAYKVKLTRKDGGIEYYSIDQKSGLLVKKVSNRMVRGKESSVANYFLNYRKVQGIPFPFIIDSTIDGQPYSSNQFETIELNTPVDVKIFEMEGK